MIAVRLYGAMAVPRVLSDLDALLSVVAVTADTGTSTVSGSDAPFTRSSSVDGL